MLKIKLDKSTKIRLQMLCKKTGRTKSYYAKKAIKEFIDDREDYFLAVTALEEGGEFISLADVRKNIGF